MQKDCRNNAWPALVCVPGAALTDPASLEPILLHMGLPAEREVAAVVLLIESNGLLSGVPCTTQGLIRIVRMPICSGFPPWPQNQAD